MNRKQKKMLIRILDRRGNADCTAFYSRQTESCVWLSILLVLSDHRI